MNLSDKERERFERYIGPPDENGCWLWIGGTDKDGYGRFYLRKRKVSAHILSYQLHRQVYCPGLQIGHRCRVRKCCNPEHLELQSQSRNLKARVFSRVKQPSTPAERAKNYRERKKRLQADIPILREKIARANILPEQLYSDDSLASAAERRLLPAYPYDTPETVDV